MEKVISYKKVETISYDKEHNDYKEEGGRLYFHKTFYSLNEVKDAIKVIELNNTMEEANEDK